ncbi:hypothetical protein ACHAXR_003487 [Thalassiosira sp. AJA248-18]
MQQRRPFKIAILIYYLITLNGLIAMTCSSLRLANQRVLVTGAGRGIGRAIALVCSREGARVAITSRTLSELEDTALQARTSSGRPLETLSSDDLRSILDLNVVSVHTVTAAVLRHAMLPAGSGKIINISSRAGKVGLPNYSHYCASKFALEGMAAALAEEVKDKGIEVNTLSPGMVNTASFPKPAGKKGVRSAESAEDSLFALIEGGVTGHYIHADELDEIRANGLKDRVALKPIREAMFSP